MNMAGCEWGRDCWGEMEHYKALSKNFIRDGGSFGSSRIVLCSVLFNLHSYFNSR